MVVRLSLYCARLSRLRATRASVAACSTRREHSTLVGRGRGTVGGSACLRPERASSREIRSSHHTRCCVRTEHSPPYLVSIECHTFISRVALFPSPPHRFFRNFRGPTSHSKVLDQRHSTTPTSLLAIDQKLPATDRPAPLLGLAPKISHVIRLLDHSTTATNVAIPTTGFQCLKDVRGNYVRDCWETTAQRP